MKPKISTGYLTPQATKTKKQTKPLSANKPSSGKPTNKTSKNDVIDEKIFHTMMNDPVKKAMIMQLLSLNKDAIEDYKKKEAQGKGSPLDKVKKKRQIESPTSLLRRRALEKLNSVEDPSSNTSDSASVASSRPPSALSEKSSELSHGSSESPVPFEKVMDGVVAYVEIKSKDQDRSGGAKKILQAMGAKVREQFTRDVTHVIFKDGSFATYQKAKLMKAHLVSILWLEFSRKSLQRQPEKKFPAMRANYFDDNNTSMICSQMQKEYEDIIRDEYRQSLINGTPLPTTRSFIDRRRTIMTTSSASDFQTTINSSSQEISDREVAEINKNNSKCNQKEVLTINSLDFFNDNCQPKAGDPLKSLENTHLLTPDNRQTTKYSNSDMDLTYISTENRISDTIYQKRTPKINDDSLNEQTPLRKSSIAPTTLFDRRKTICSSTITSDESLANNRDSLRFKKTTISSTDGKNGESKKGNKKNKDKFTNGDLTHSSSKASDSDKKVVEVQVHKEDSDVTHCSLISSDKSSDLFAKPTKTFKKTRKTQGTSSVSSRMSLLEISDDENGLEILSGNICKPNLKRQISHSPQRKSPNSLISSLNQSSEKPSNVVTKETDGKNGESKIGNKKNKDKSIDTELTHSSLIAFNSDKKVVEAQVHKEDSDVTHCSLISSDKSSDLFAKPTKTSKKTRKTQGTSSVSSRMSLLEVSDDENGLEILSGNICKPNLKRQISHSPQRKSSNSRVSSLNLSSEKPSNLVTKEISSLFLSSHDSIPKKKSSTTSSPNSFPKRKSSSSTAMSSLHLSSEKPVLDAQLIVNNCRKITERFLSKEIDNPVLETSKQSFASSDKSMRLNENEIDNVLKALQSPTLNGTSASVDLVDTSKNSYDDSEIEIPKDVPKKISKVVKKNLKKDKKLIDNQTLLNWLTEGDEEIKNIAQEDKNNVNSEPVKKDIAEIIDSEIESESHNLKITRKSINVTKRKNKKAEKGSSMECKNNNSNVTRKTINDIKPQNGKKQVKKNRGASDSSGQDSSPSKNISETIGTHISTRRLTRRMSMQQSESQGNKDISFKKPQAINDQKRKTLNVHSDSEGNAKTKSKKRRTKSENTTLRHSDSENRSSVTSGSESDSNNQSKNKKRKLFDPTHFTPKLSQPDDERDRQERFMEIKKRKSLNPNNGDVIKQLSRPQDQNPSVSRTDLDKDLDDILSKAFGNKSPKKKQISQRNKQKVKTPNSSMDEQKSLLDDLLSRKAKTSTKKTPKSKKPQFLKPTSAKTLTTRGNKCGKTPVVKLFAKNSSSTSGESSPEKKSTPRNYLNRRSTLDFQPRVQNSPTKKPKTNKTKLPTIVCTKLHKDDVQVFTKIVRKLGGFALEDEVSSRTTHVVAGEPKRTINMLRAVARGCWVLKHEWLLKSLENGKWLPEEDYEVTDFAPVVQQSRLERQAFGASYSMNIFHDCDPIYVALSTNPRCSDLRELITLCKGKVVTSQRMARIVVGEFINENDVICVNETWVLDCITFNKKLPFQKKYLLKQVKGRKSLAV